MLSSLLGSLLGVITNILTIVYAFTGLFGGTVQLSTENPIKLVDPENCNMAFVALADTHLRDTAFQPHLFANGLADIDNAETPFDALVIAGDISEFGDGPSYDVTWEKLDNSEIGKKPVLLATGNHDIRLAYEYQTNLIMARNAQQLGIEIDKPYYSYEVNGYKFIVMGSDTWEFEKAGISEEQLAFIDAELTAANGKPAFVICHQALANTHGLPEVWKNGDLGKDSEAVKAVLMKHKNVFFMNGHLHDGVYEKSLEIFDAEKGVYSINLPAYGKENDYGKYLQNGLGAYVEVYDDCVIFTSRDFARGVNLEGYTYTFSIK